MQTSDKLVICKKCGGPMCYESLHENNIKSWMCLNCGFQTLSLLKNNSDYHIQYEKTLPELYKDLKYIDINENVWYPITLNFPERGIVFADGTSKDNWGWTAMLATEVLDEEKERYKKPGLENEYFTFKMDSKTKKIFTKDNYVAAVNYIGLFEK